VSESADVVVVGGGVVGASVAYELATAGVRVVVLERDAIGSGATGHGHGVISLVGMDFRPGPHFALGLTASRLYADFAAALEQESGIDPLYHELDGISLAVIEEERQIYQGFMARADALGHVAMRWASVDEIRALEPRLTEDALGGVLYRHGQVDGYRLTLAAIKAVERRGGRVLLREATGLLRRGNTVVGVAHAGGTIACDHVVLAGGAWSAAASAWVEFPVPVRPLHGEVLHVRLPGQPLRIFVLTARHGPILPRRDGIVMVGSIGGVSMSGVDVDVAHVFDPFDRTPPEFDGRPRPASRDLMIERAERVMPAIGNAQLVAHLAGVRPLSADRLPLIGPVPGLSGVLLATGHGTKGIHLAPITGRIVSDLLLGRPPAVAIEPFLPERFAFASRG
jgi:glycine oxidase